MQFIKNRVGSDVSNISPDQTGLIITKLRFSDVNEKNCVINSSEHVHVNRYQKNRKYIDSVVLHAFCCTASAEMSMGWVPVRDGLIGLGWVRLGPVFHFSMGWVWQLMCWVAWMGERKWTRDISVLNIYMRIPYVRGCQQVCLHY